MVEAPKSNLVRISNRDESRPSNDGYLDQIDTFVNLTIGSIGPTVMMKQSRGRPLLVG